MAKDPYRIDEYSFMNREEYERALKEKETVAYLQANTGSNNNKALLKVYNRSVEKKSFHTIIGTEYLSSLRRQLIASGIVTEEMLAPVPVTRTTAAGNQPEQSGQPDHSQLERQAARYKAAYESARAGRIIKNMTILILIVVIIAILLITYQSRYSVFTYFTNYKEEMREELIDEYVDWENQLEQKEQELNDREAALQNREP